MRAAGPRPRLRPRRARARSPRRSSLPPTARPAFPRATAVRPHLSCAPASHRPDPPFPSALSRPAPLRGGGRPLPQVSIERLPAPPADTDPPAPRPPAPSPSRSARPGLAASPFPGCTAAGARWEPARCAGRAAPTDLPRRPGRGRAGADQPRPPPPRPWAAAPAAASREHRAEGGAAWKTATAAPAGPLDVSMAATNLENQLHSAQKNLLFLQREHASTLKGLHAEIRRLQQHCTDLTYELTLKSSEQTGDGAPRSGDLKQRCGDLEAQLQAREREHGELRQELEQKNAMIAVLENTIKERERKYLEELKAKSHRLNLLSGELEQRAATVAYLTSQLHAARKKLLSSSGASDASPAGSPVLAAYKPAPPKDKLPETPRRRMKKSLSAPLHPELEEVYRFGTEGRKLLLREPVDAMPDPTPFLLARESADVHLIKERPLVIPPIASDRSSAEHPSPGREKPHKAHVGVAHRIHHAAPAPAPAPAEVETLAVDQVNGGKVVRKPSGADRTV